MTTHDTIVIGATKDKEILFFKSFTHKEQQDEFQDALSHAQTYPIWYASGLRAGRWELVGIVPAHDENEKYTFNIPLP